MTGGEIADLLAWLRSRAERFGEPHLTAAADLIESRAAEVAMLRAENGQLRRLLGRFADMGRNGFDHGDDWHRIVFRSFCQEAMFWLDSNPPTPREGEPRA